MKYTFYMRDAWGDDYRLTVEAETEEQARREATLADDDANPTHLLGVGEQLPL